MANRTFSNRRTVTREEIAQRAYEIWESAGHPEGQDASHWLQAEAELSVQASVPPSQPRPVRRAETPVVRARAVSAHN